MKTLATNRWGGDRLLTIACVIVPLIALTLFFIYPMFTVFLRSITLVDGSLGLQNYAQTLASTGFWRATEHSLLMGFTTMVFSVFLGFIIALGLHRCSFRGKWIIRTAIIMPLLAPSLVQALGLIFLLGRNGVINRVFGLELDIYGFWGLTIANTLYAIPQVVMIIGASLVLLDARIYEAAEIMGAKPLRQFRDLTLPAIFFALLNAAFVVFIVTITDFGNAAVIGGDYSVLATEIYTQVVGLRNFNMGAVVGIMLLLPTVVSYYIERKAMKRQQGVLATNIQPFVPSFLASRDIPMAAACFFIAAMILSVVAIVVYASFVKLWPYNFDFTLKHFDITIAGGYSSLWITIAISLGAAIGGTFLIFILTLGLLRLPAAISQAIQVLAAMPAALYVVWDSDINCCYQFLSLSYTSFFDNNDWFSTVSHCIRRGLWIFRGRVRAYRRQYYCSFCITYVDISILFPLYALNGDFISGCVFNNTAA